MDMDELYQEIILDHYRNPRNAGDVSDEVLLVEEENPMCGDQIRLTARVTDGVVTDVCHDSRGCAISMASSSMMSEAVVGKPLAEARAIIENFVELMRGEKDSDPEGMGDLIALEGVRHFPMRIKCATMCWHAIDDALNQITRV